MFGKFDCLSHCPDLGKCCREFQLSINGKPVRYIHGDEPNFPAVMKKLKEDGLPFHIKLYNVETYDLLFTCPELGEDGKCKIYESRPAFCRNFEPKSDKVLCCLKPSFIEKVILLFQTILKRILNVS